MDQALIKLSAQRLDSLLRQYRASNAEARQLSSALSSLIDDAIAGKIQNPMEWASIPGGINFTEGTLGGFDDLETAYAQFKIELTGGESPVLRRMRLERAGKS